MARILISVLIFLLIPFCKIFSQGEPFTGPVEINILPSGTGNDYRLAHPYEILYGPDNYLYITEKIGRVIRVNPTTGIRQIILDHTSNTYVTVSRNGGGWATSVGQDGMMGMALHPNFSLGTGQDSIFIAYTYAAGNLRISRFRYNGGGSPSLSGETILIQGIPANNDHSSGRLIIGGDNKLYYSCGDMGYNQFGNRCNEIRSQKLPSGADISSNNYSRYSGKILRINFDGSIPSDNPSFAGVQSHIFSIGHRNPQGLVWQKNANNGATYPTLTPGGKLFSSEQGPRTDDEINVIESGKNYGWPYISGDLDNTNYQYIIWATSSQCGSTTYDEDNVPPGAMVRDENDTILTNFQPPLKSLYTVCTPLPISACDAAATNNMMKYPTIAASSIDFYNLNSGAGIPGWYPSLLVTTLKRGVMLRYKLDAPMDSIVGDSIPYFRTTNRYRDIAMNASGLKIYLITDSIGTTSGPTAGSGTTSLANPGSILEYTYIGGTLALGDKPGTGNTIRNYSISVYPNPATRFIRINVSEGIFTRPVEYRLFDITGKLVLSGNSIAKNFAVNVEGLNKGVYVLKLLNGNGLDLKTEKIVIQ
ncbi:MAG: PQQ-dependent sugar dehydrogenase [Chitinophagaceae bacterium]|nr:PQQ-dependent sugar dehydrogenase [Chitinophagaceae bacterium]